MTKAPPINFLSRIIALEKTGWAVIDGGSSLSKTYKFDNFATAFVWMTTVAFEAEKLNHHPTWANAFDLVDVTLTTFETGGISRLDVQLAQKMDEAAGHA